MGQRSGGTAPYGWHSCKWKRKKVVWLTSVGAKWAHVGKLRMHKSWPKCSSSCCWGSTWPRVNFFPQWAPALRSAAAFTTTWVMDQRRGKLDAQSEMNVSCVVFCVCLFLCFVLFVFLHSDAFCHHMRTDVCTEVNTCTKDNSGSACRSNFI